MTNEMTDESDFVDRLKRAKEVILNEVNQRKAVSFIELEKLLKNNDLFIPQIGDKGTAIGEIAFRPHITLWATENRLLVEAFFQLYNEEKIQTDPADVLSYAAGGAVMDLPQPKLEQWSDDYVPKENESYWFPVVLNPYGTMTDFRKKMMKD